MTEMDKRICVGERSKTTVMNTDDVIVLLRFIIVKKDLVQDRIQSYNEYNGD